AGAHQAGSIVDQQGGVIRLETERGFVISLGLREVAVIGFVLAGEEICGGSEFGIGGLSEAGECIGIHLAVADDFFGYVGFVVERGRGRGDVGSIGGYSGGRSGSGVNGRGAAGIDALNGGFRDSVGVFAEFILDAVLVFVFADVVGPDGASILKMNDVGGRGKRRQKH